MDLATTIGIAIGLSMDAFAVAITNGFTIKVLKIHHVLRIAFFYGFFQALMPVIGWSAGLSFRAYIEPVDHWVVFGLLLVIGSKMIYEYFWAKEECKVHEHLSFYTLLILSLATSIDALAAGISFSILNISIFTPVLIIGFTTFAFSFAGVYLGKRFGCLLGNKMELAGGIILILIGIKILMEHLAQ